MGIKLEDMQIYLLDRKSAMVTSWNNSFAGIKNVKTVCADFDEFMSENKVKCVVSPANAYGLMDGGYDLAITEWFGWDLQKKVQKYIVKNLYGEQPVGTSILIDTDKEGIKLIHTPSMRYPDRIRDPLVIYQCMRTCLITAMQNEIESIVIPAFGGCTGQVAPHLIAEMMRRAYNQLSNVPNALNWRYADSSYFNY